MHAVHAGELLADQRFLGGAIHLADAQARKQLARAGGERRGGGWLQDGIAVRVAAAVRVPGSRGCGSGRAAGIGAMFAAMAGAVTVIVAGVGIVPVAVIVAGAGIVPVAVIVAGVGIVPVAVVVARVRIVPTAGVLAGHRRMVVAAAGVIAWLLKARDGDRRRLCRRMIATAAGAAVPARLMFALFDRR
ncbi:hypothetical protein [Achromobacter sp.]|uniref:hypothetical protein n=1 Tax=Achromobacter sp. TaxID=134375 RepID=UPI002896A1CE|nr:hypothetical protein [Achromobacter sp.]